MWDENKRKLNLKKHGLDFVRAEEVLDGIIVMWTDERFEYGEARFNSLEFLRGLVVHVSHAERGDIIRVISMRKATSNEAKIYFDQISENG